MKNRISNARLVVAAMVFIVNIFYALYLPFPRSNGFELLVILLLDWLQIKARASREFIRKGTQRIRTEFEFEDHSFRADSTTLHGQLTVQ